MRKEAMVVSVFAEPLAQARQRGEMLKESLANASQAFDVDGRQVLASEMKHNLQYVDALLAALDLIEQRATDMEQAIQKRRKAGHNDTCDFVLGLDPPLPCSCGHDQMCAALSAREEQK